MTGNSFRENSRTSFFFKKKKKKKLWAATEWWFLQYWFDEIVCMLIATNTESIRESEMYQKTAVRIKCCCIKYVPDSWSHKQWLESINLLILRVHYYGNTRKNASFI